VAFEGLNHLLRQVARAVVCYVGESRVSSHFVVLYDYYMGIKAHFFPIMYFCMMYFAKKKFYQVYIYKQVLWWLIMLYFLFYVMFIYIFFMFQMFIYVKYTNPTCNSLMNLRPY
jgi:hypothetical protein